MPDGTIVTSVNQVILASSTDTYLVGSSSKTVVIGGLKELTTYNTYCYLRNILGFSSSLSDMLATKRVVTTACCRTIAFTNSPSTVYGDGAAQYSSGQTLQYHFVFSLSSAPSSTVTVEPKLFQQNGTALSTNYISVLPASLVFTTTSTALTGSFILKGSEYAKGSFVIRLALSGLSGSQYDTISTPVTVISSFTAAPAPKLVASRFEDSGGSIFIYFDSATDKGRIAAQSWRCNALFSYPGSLTSSCSWLNGTVVRAIFGPYNSAEELVEVSSLISVRPGLIRAVCKAGASQATCLTYDTTAAMDVTLLAPQNPLAPIAILNAPSTMSSCDNVTIDATSTAGRVGREWSGVSWQVTSSAGSAGQITDLLASKGTDLTKRIIVPATYFSTATYSISLTVTNYFGKSSSATALTTKNANPNQPMLTVLGSSYLVIKPNQPTTIRSSTRFATCAEYVIISYSWSVRLNGVVVPIANPGNDPTALLLVANTLTAGNVYDITVSAAVPATSRFPSAVASASIQLEVKSGSVLAQVYGGVTRRVFIENLVAIDGSLSYDENSGTPAKSRLRYLWTCSMLGAADFGTSCNSVLVGRNASSSVLLVAGNTFDPAKVYGFTLTATAADGRFGTVTVSIQQLAPNTPTASISTTKSTVNANFPLSLFGVVTADYAIRAQWSASVEGSSLSLSQALTPVTKTFSKQEAANGILFPLIFPGGLLTQGTAVTFRLIAVLASLNDNTYASINEIVVGVNSAPTGGKITSSPSSGSALLTLFSTISSEWSDVDIPLTYDFSHFISSALPVMNIKLRSSSNVASTELPEGSVQENYVITIINNIYDNNLAFTNVNSSVIVTASQVDPTSYFNSKAVSYDSTADSSLATAALNNVALTVNRVNCTLASPATCRGLNRQPCQLTTQTCSSCLPGFSGRSGSANSLCFNATVAAVNSTMGRINDPCASNNQCFYGSCVSNICVAPVKSCPSNSAGICSGHGACIYVDQQGKVLAKVCTISDTFCSATCTCADGYGGSDCSLTAAGVASRSSTRAAMCEYVVRLSNTLEHSSQLLDALVGSLLVAYDAAEVTSPGAITVCEEALTAVTELAAEGFLRNALSSTKTFLVNLVSKFVVPASNNSTGIASINSDQVNAAASNVARAFLDSMVDGQDPQFIVSENAQYVFRRDLVSEIVNTVIEAPSTEDGAAFNTASSGIQLLGPAVEACNNGQGYVGLSLMQWGNNPFTQSNGSTVGSAQIKLDNFGSNNSYAGPTNRSTIAYYIINQFNVPQDFNFSISLADALIMHIPNFTFPQCTLFDGESYVPCRGCSVSSYTNYNVTFACTDPFQLCGGRKAGRRLHDYAHLSQWERPQRYLQNGDDDATNSVMTGSNTVQYAALFEAIGSQISNVLSRNPFAVDWAKASAIVTFVSLMLFGLCAGYVFFAHWDKIDRGFLVYAKNETDKARIKLRHAYMLKMQLQDQKVNSSSSEREAAVMKARKMFRISENTYHILQEAFEKEHEARINLRKKLNGSLSRLSHRFGFGDLPAGSFKTTTDDTGAGGGRAKLSRAQSKSEKLFDMFSEEQSERHLEYNAVFEDEGEDSVETKDELYVANVVADFLISVMPEGSVSQGKQRYMGLLNRMLKEHDYTAMFYDPSLKYPRSLRWLNVCMQLLINLFVDTIFFGMFYPDTGLCEQHTTKTTCDVAQNAVLDSPLCRWIADSQECLLTPPPQDFTFQCILVVLCQIVGLPIAFFYDILLKEYCAKRPDLEQWGLNTMYFLGRSTQNKQSGATQEATQSKLKDLFHEMDEIKRKAREADIASHLLSKQVSARSYFLLYINFF